MAQRHPSGSGPAARGRPGGRRPPLDLVDAFGFTQEHLRAPIASGAEKQRQDEARAYYAELRASGDAPVAETAAKPAQRSPGLLRLGAVAPPVWGGATLIRRSNRNQSGSEATMKRARFSGLVNIGQWPVGSSRISKSVIALSSAT